MHPSQIEALRRRKSNSSLQDRPVLAAKAARQNGTAIVGLDGNTIGAPALRRAEDMLRPDSRKPDNGFEDRQGPFILDVTLRGRTVRALNLHSIL